MSSHCPLTYVKCEFSDAGCDAKVYRKDLASHLADNLVTHMSLLATENRKLKLQLERQEEKVSKENKELILQLQKKEERAALESRNLTTRLETEATEKIRLNEEATNLKTQLEKKDQELRAVKYPLRCGLPIELECPSFYFENSLWWTSQPFASSAGYLQVKINFACKKLYEIFVTRLECDSYFPKFKVTIVLQNLKKGYNSWTFHREVRNCASTEHENYYILNPYDFVGSCRLLFHVTSIRHL